MRTHCFPISVWNSSQTIVLTTARSPLDVTTLSGMEKEAAFLHKAEFANAPCIIALRKIFFTNSTCYSLTILFGRRKETVFLDVRFASGYDCTRSRISITTKNHLIYHAATCSKYHFDGNVFGAPKKYEYSCYTLSYKQTGGITTGKVVATLPTVIINCSTFNEENVRDVIADAALYNSFN